MTQIACVSDINMACISTMAIMFLFVVVCALCALNCVDCREGKLLKEEHLLYLQSHGRGKGTGNGGARASCDSSSFGSNGHQLISKGSSSIFENCNASSSHDSMVMKMLRL